MEERPPEVGTGAGSTAEGAAGMAASLAESRFLIAAEALAGFLYDWDLVADRVTRVGGLEALLGFRPEEVPPDAGWWEQRVHPDDLPQAARACQVALEGGATGFAVVYRVRHRDGHHVHVADRARIVRDAAGRPLRVVGGTSDISARIEAEADRARLVAALEVERARLAALIAQAPAFIAVLRGPDHVYERVNDRYQQLIGFRSVLGRPVRDAVPELAAQGIVARLDAVFATGEPYAENGLRVWLQRSPGAAPEECINVVYQPIVEADGRRSGVLVHGVDVTAQVRALEQLAETQRIARIGSWTWEVASGRTTWSEEMERLHGLGPGEASATVAEYAAHVHPDDRAAVQAAIERILTAGEPLTHDYRVVRPDGAVRVLHGRAHGETDEAGRVIRVRGSCQDVTERVAVQAALQASEARYRHLALHDPLTGLANRALFLDRVEHAVARASRAESAVALLFLDLDGFKALNDSAGHGAGDGLLVQAAERIRRAVRAADTVARFGGDEFAVLLEGTHAEHAAAQAVEVAARVIAALAEPLALAGRAYRVGVSVGIAAPRDPVTTTELLHQADRAMYAAKTRGGGRHVLFETGLEASPLEPAG